MASLTTRKLSPAFVAELAKLQSALDSWRKQRKSREPIPESLWWDMVRLARAYRASPVAQLLRVNYTSLKRRLRASLLMPEDDDEQNRLFKPSDPAS